VNAAASSRTARAMRPTAVIPDHLRTPLTTGHSFCMAITVRGRQLRRRVQKYTLEQGATGQQDGIETQFAETL